MGVKRILLVEDDFDIGEALGELLRDLGHSVELATNGAHALERLRANGSGNGSDKYDVILLDLMMPVMDGYEFRRLQLAEARFARIPVVIISADATPRQEARLRECGARDYVTKPLDVPKLLEAIEEALAYAQSL